MAAGSLDLIGEDDELRDDAADSPCLSPGSVRSAPRADGVQRLQDGVVRTNCLDCLDRTNVVQNMIARVSIVAQLRDAFGCLPPGADLESALAAEPALADALTVLWAEHGDALARFYSGTGAMKADFSRTGKRTVGGLFSGGCH